MDRGAALGHSDPLPYTSGRGTWLPRAMKSPAASGLETFSELAEWVHRRPPLGFPPGALALTLSQPAGPGPSCWPMARAERRGSSPYLGRAASPLGSGAALRANSSPRQGAGGRRRDSKAGRRARTRSGGGDQAGAEVRGPASQGPPNELGAHNGSLALPPASPGTALPSVGQGGPGGSTVTSPPFWALLRGQRRSRY